MPRLLAKCKDVVNDQIMVYFLSPLDCSKCFSNLQIDSARLLEMNKSFISTYFALFQNTPEYVLGLRSMAPLFFKAPFLSVIPPPIFSRFWSFASRYGRGGLPRHTKINSPEPLAVHTGGMRVNVPIVFSDWVIF